VEARVRFRFPQDFPFGQFLQEHHDVEFLLLNRLPFPPHHIVAEVRIRSPIERDWVTELRSVPGIESVQSLESSGRPDMFRYKWSPPEYLPAMLEKYDLIGFVPILVSKGYGTLSIALSKDRLMRFFREARTRGFSFEIVELRPFRGPEQFGGLTPKQRARFEAAVETGYFDVPRRTTLDELARRFAVQKSAFAESLALARRKVLLAGGHALLAEQGRMLRNLASER
jgi:hypothetical protein